MAASIQKATSGERRLCQIAAETRWYFDGDGELTAPHALLQFGCGADRRAFGEITGARETLEQPAACRRMVLVEGRIFQIFDIERDAIAHRKHQNDRTDKGERQPYGIAQELYRLAPGISPEASGIEPPGSLRRTDFAFLRGRLRHGLGLPRLLCSLRRGLSLLSFSGCRRFLQVGNEGVLQSSAAVLLDQLLRGADREHPPLVHQ